MPKQLTTQNATITTAAVEVKTLTISGKQVTLAVFRQLRNEPLIDAGGNLLGEPWGYVNYHPGKCADSEPHRHVVWQRGNELLRASITDAADFDRVTPGGSHLGQHWYSSAAVNRYLDYLVFAGLTAGDESVLEVKPRRASRWDVAEGASFDARLVLPPALAGTNVFPVLGTASDLAVAAADAAERLRAYQAVADTDLDDFQRKNSAEWQETLRTHRRGDVEAARGKRDAAMQALRDLIETHGGFDAIDYAYGTEIEAEAARREQHRATRDELAKLPQLFIAV